MCQSALNSAIRHNTALGNATQYNIQVFATHMGNAFPKLNGGSDLTLDQRATVFEFLKAMINPDPAPSWLPQNGNQITSSDDLGSHNPAGTELCLSGLLPKCFPALAGFRDDWLNSIRNYCRYSSSAIQLLELKKFNSIADWISSSSPEILLIDVKDERGESSWTTDLLLEMTGVFEAPNVESKGINSAIVAHLCRKRAERKSYGEATLLQDFLFQIIEAYSEKFQNPRECQQDGLTETKLRSAADKPEDLWDLIVKCIKRTHIRMLVIMLDHIEEIFLQNFGATGRGSFEKFVENLRNNIEILHKEHRIVVKTMVTCRLDEAALYFYEIGATSIVMRSPPRRRFLTED